MKRGVRRVAEANGEGRRVVSPETLETKSGGSTSLFVLGGIGRIVSSTDPKLKSETLETTSCVITARAMAINGKDRISGDRP